jgi:hypothetical protein
MYCKCCNLDCAYNQPDGLCDVCASEVEIRELKATCEELAMSRQAANDALDIAIHERDQAWKEIIKLYYKITTLERRK